MVQNSVVSKLFLDSAVLTMLHSWSRHLYEVVFSRFGVADPKAQDDRDMDHFTTLASCGAGLLYCMFDRRT